MGGDKGNMTSQLIKLTFLNANPNPEIIAADSQEGKVNYFIGSDPKKWRTNVPTYRAVVYKEVYPGIDIKFYGSNRQMEYDIIVKPGADPSKVKFAYEGIEGMKVAENGDLEINLSSRSPLVGDGRGEGNKLIQKRPIIYQEIDGKNVAVDGQFVISRPEGSKQSQMLLSPSNDNKEAPSSKNPIFAYSFEVSFYDKNHPLIIDPVLVYSTYLGGSSDDFGCCIDIDASGNIYVMGWTVSTDFPATPGAYDSTHNGGWWDEFIVKLDASGSSLVYATYLGENGYDYGKGIAVDASGDLYITGATYSTNFPTTTGAYDTTYNGNGDIFVVKLNPDGSALLYSTLVGGSNTEDSEGIALDASGNAYVTGYTNSTNFPTTSGAFDVTPNGGNDVYVLKVNSTGTALSYSTLIGGSGSDGSAGISIDTLGNVYVAGVTFSADFPTTPSAYDTTYNGNGDFFVVKVNMATPTLSYATYLGGSNPEGGPMKMTIDAAGNTYVMGSTDSTDFPVTLGAYDTTYKGSGDIILLKLNGDGSSLSYATYIGGSGYDIGWGFAVDSSGNSYVAGSTYSTDFPVTPGAYDTTFNGGIDAFVLKLNPTGATLSYATYLGGSSDDSGAGIVIDNSGNAYVIGRTESSNFPTTSGSYDTTYNGSSDVFVAKIFFEITTDMSDWMKMECGPWENTAEGLKVYGTYYRGGNLIKSKSAYNFIDKELFIKWKTNNGGSFSAYGLGLLGVDLEISFSSPNACCQTYTKAITNDTWYYTRIKINPDKTAQHVTSTNDYDINGGTVFASGTKTISDAQWQMVDKTNIVFQAGDSYAGANSYFVIGEVITDAMPVPINFGSITTYDFEDGTIPSSFYSTGNWTIANDGYNSSRSLYINTSQNSNISLDVTDAVAVSFKILTVS